MEDALPVYNSVNAPLELCEQVKERFLQFLNGYVISDSLDDGPSQSITHSQGSGEEGGVWGELGEAMGAPQRPPLALCRACHHPWQPSRCCLDGQGRARRPPGSNAPRLPACPRPLQAAAPPSRSASTWSSWQP